MAVSNAATLEHTYRWPPMGAGVMEGRGEMRKRRGEREADSGGALIRAWRWLRSSGYYEDDQAKERFWRAAGTQVTFWKMNR
jgi:hypothetical protein